MADLPTLITQFHFLRPELLALLPLCVLIFWLLKHRTANHSQWQKIIDSDLLKHLMPESNTRSFSKLLPTLAFLTALIGIIALAGPTYEQQKQPVIKNQDALVIVLDLTLSMNAEDTKPSRLISAKRKIEDLLKRRTDGVTGLVVFSGSAHTVSPLTDDKQTLLNMLPALDPKIMPSFGNNVVAGIDQAIGLFKKTAIKKGRIVLLTDEIKSPQFKTIDEHLPPDISLSIIGFGTEAGAPIPYNGFLKDPNTQAFILAKLNWQEISQQAKKYHFTAARSTFNDRDIEHLGLTETQQHIDEQKTASKRQSALWVDAGQWLPLLMIPFLLLLFRRGWILLLVCYCLPDTSYALSWDTLWKTQDQQAQTLMKDGDTEQAAQTFKDPDWKAAALYKNTAYKEAEEAYKNAPDKNADTYYNLGTTQTQLKNYAEAIQSYTKALELSPGLKDAQANRAIAEKLQAQKKQEQQSKDQKDQDNDQQDQDQKDQEQQSQDQKDQEQKSQDQQGQDQKNQEQQDQDQKDQKQKSQDQQSQDNKDQEQKSQEQQNQNQNQKEKEKEKEKEQKSQEKRNKEEKESEQESVESRIQEEDKSNQTPEQLEQERALQHFLKKLPDNAGGLLKRKFNAQFQHNRRNNSVIDKESDQVW